LERSIQREDEIPFFLALRSTEPIDTCELADCIAIDDELPSRSTKTEVPFRETKLLSRGKNSTTTFNKQFPVFKLTGVTETSKKYDLRNETCKRCKTSRRSTWPLRSASIYGETP
jgi:hypothetical protein